MMRNSPLDCFLRHAQNGRKVGVLILRTASRVGITTALLLSASLVVARTFGPGQQDPAPGCPAQDIVTLSSGQPVRRSLRSGEQNCFRISLAAGQFIRVIVTPYDLDVAVALFGPEGEKLAEVSSFDNIEGDAVLIRVAAKAGVYRLEIRPADVDMKPGGYVAQVAELRMNTPRDTDLVAGEEALAAARQGLASRKPDALAAAIIKYEEARSLFHQAGDPERESLALRSKAGILFVQGKAPDALRLMEEGQRLIESKYGPQHV